MYGTNKYLYIYTYICTTMMIYTNQMIFLSRITINILYKYVHYTYVHMKLYNFKKYIGLTVNDLIRIIIVFLFRNNLKQMQYLSEQNFIK